MKSTELTVKIDTLPDNLKKMAEDYIEYLLVKAEKQASEDAAWGNTLTERTKQSELDIKHGRVSTEEEVRKDFLKMVESHKAK